MQMENLSVHFEKMAKALLVLLSCNFHRSVRIIVVIKGMASCPMHAATKVQNLICKTSKQKRNTTTSF